MKITQYYSIVFIRVLKVRSADGSAHRAHGLVLMAGSDYFAAAYRGGWADAAGPLVLGWVERFDRRGSEPFELFTSEFGRNSVKIQYILLLSRKFRKFRIFQHVR